MVEGDEVTSDQKRGEEIDLAFGLPQKLLRTDEYPLRATVDAPLMSSNMSNDGVYDAQDAAMRALYPSLLRAQAAGQAGVATALRYPIFTPAQWQELQRQALIYKHLVACVPVPPDLLFDPRALLSIPPLYPALARGGGYFGLRFPADSTDPEPGRCRRTDGKKWRCTRDVAPDQKYCERHMHRGRPRSRKPVERTQRNAATVTATTTTATSTTTNTTTTTAKIPKPDVKLPFLSMVPEKETRYMDWMKVAMEGGPVLEGYQDQHQSSSYSDLNDPCYTFLNTELPSMDHPRDHPRSFIDAWSTEGHGFNNRSQASSSSTRLSPSMLTLSMSACGEENEHVQTGLVPTVGGPLGEALGLGNVVSPKGSYSGLMDLMGKSDSRSPRESPPRVLSSPTGVLQRTLVSLSDSSSNSSPTFAAGGRLEVGLQWAAQGKKW